VVHLIGRYEALVNSLERPGAARNRETNKRVAKRLYAKPFPEVLD
jgi:hypothetical protein